MKYIYLPSTERIHASCLVILCWLGFQSLISADLKCPLTSTENDVVLLPNVINLQTVWKLSVFPPVPWHIVLTMFSEFELCTPQMTIDHHQKHDFSTQYNASTCHVWKVFKYPCLRSCVNHVFWIWLLYTSDEHCPPPKTIQFFCSIQCIPMWSKKSTHASYLEILY